MFLTLLAGFVMFASMWVSGVKNMSRMRSTCFFASTHATCHLLEVEGKGERRNGGPRCCAVHFGDKKLSSKQR